MIHIVALLLSSLALGRAARVQELGEVVNEVSEAVKEKHAETVQGVTYDELKDRTCTSTAWTFCDSPAIWRGKFGGKGNFCCLQGHYTCDELGITGKSRCNSPSVWTGEHCCTKVTPRPQRLLHHNHNGGYHSGGYDVFNGKACKGRNELGAFSWSSVANCQSKCNADPTCVSFEWNPRKLMCKLSTSCTVRELSTYPDFVIYIKKSDSYMRRSRALSARQCNAWQSKNIPRGTDNGKIFRCLGGQCIPMQGRCNGVANCHDGSDEMDCIPTTPRPTTTTTTRFHDGPSAIKAIDSSTCLSVSGNTISASHCNGRSGQTWEWTHEGVDGAGAFGSLKNVETGRCLDIGVDSCEKGTDLILDKCSAHKRNQQFQPFSDGVHFHWIKAKACTNRPFRQDLCLDVNMKSNDKNVILWSCKMSWSASGNQRTWLGSPAHVWR